MGDSYKLMDVVAEHLPRRATVVDVGGGTGLMAETLLDERNDLTITLVEPSKEMAEIADTRLESPHRVVRGTLDDALPDLDPPTAFLFNRSLYALHGRAEDDAELMGRLFEALLPGGFLGIMEVGQKYDLVAMKKRMDEVADDVSGWDTTRYAQGWPIVVRAMETFNSGVEDGRFTLFEAGDIEELAEGAGFAPVHGDFPVYLYRKPKRSWFHFGR